MVLALSLVAAVGGSVPAGAQVSGVIGSWRTYSARITYDAGGGGGIGTLSSRLLVLSTNGTWRYGSSTGRYTVSPISASDWPHWKAKPYGPTRKITWFNWAGRTADGPIEEKDGAVTFLWVVYHEDPPTVKGPGTVWLKFGHTRP